MEPDNTTAPAPPKTPDPPGGSGNPVTARMFYCPLSISVQIWLHVVSLIRNGLHSASGTKGCLKLPSVTTLFLVKAWPSSVYLLS